MRTFILLTVLLHVLMFLIVWLVSYSGKKFDTMVNREIRDIMAMSQSGSPQHLTEAAINHLPQPVKKWLVTCGAVGNEITLNGKIEQKALMKMKPGQPNWYSAEAIQYTVINEPAFVWSVKLKLNRLLTIVGRDKFVDGKGRMLIKMSSLISVVNEQGDKIDEGSLQRFLGEMVWFPSLAVSPFVTWEEIDQLSAKATMSYKGTVGSGIFYFNHEGDFIKFSAMRFHGNEPMAERKEWILTVNDYSDFEGIRAPSNIEAAWNLDGEKWTWLKLEVSKIEYNVDLTHN